LLVLMVRKARKVCRVQTRQCPVPLVPQVSLVRWVRKASKDRQGRKA
jgi:hypothetical protein